MMKQSLVVLVIFGLLLTVATANLNNNERRILGGRKAAPQGWRWLSDRQEQDRVFFIVQLRDHSNGEVQQWISATLEAVSSPQSERYGQYLSYEQVAAQVSPPEDYFAAVEGWLSSHGIVHSLGRPGGFDQVVRRLNSLHVSTDVVKAESLLHTSFARFVSLVDADKVVVRQLGDFSIPAALNPFVDHIFGLSEFLPVRSKDHFLRDVTEQLRAHLSKHDPASTAKIQLPPVVYNGSNTFVTPDTIRNYYGIPLDQRSTTIQSAFADDQWFDASALNAFCTDNALPNTTCGVSHYVGWNCLASPLYAKLCANLEDEAQLDVQTLTGVASTLPGSAGGTWFWQVLSSAQEFLTESLWILVWAQQVNAQTGNNVPLVHSVSYGFPEVLQCLVGSYKCSTLGYDAEQYVSATDQQLQLFGIRGWTVLVSSGDDAAQGFAQNFPVTPASNTVNQLIIDNGVFQCMFPSGADSNVECSQILRKDGTGNTTEQGVPCLTAWTQYTSSPNQYVPQCSPRFVNPLMQVEIQNGTIIVPSMTSSCSTSQYPETVISGCRIRPWVYDPANGQPFFPDYPTSSPWVTSVGATQFYCDAAADGSCAGPTYEVVASSSTGALITSGGGFSLFHSMPYWQAPVVNQYLATAQLPPAGTFNATGRAYPDISLNGHMYLVILAVKGSPAVAAVDGTSASAPALAAMLTLWNSALAAAGKPSLGFFNPLLYTMYAENPSLFNDITQGDIACVRYTVGVCSQWTFYAQKGYDVASGVGTPRFLQVQNYLLSN